jgi:hypothetical protein
MDKSPDFRSLGASEQQVIRVFVEVAGEAGCEGGHVVEKAPFIGGGTLFSGQPAEDLAL